MTKIRFGSIYSGTRRNATTEQSRSHALISYDFALRHNPIT